MEAVFWIETVEYTLEVPVFEPGHPPLVIPAPTGAGQPVPRFLVPSARHQGTALHHGPDHADPVLTAGLPELQRPDLAARLGGHARSERPHPGPALRLGLIKRAPRASRRRATAISVESGSCGRARLNAGQRGRQAVKVACESAALGAENRGVPGGQ